MAPTTPQNKEKLQVGHHKEKMSIFFKLLQSQLCYFI